MTPTGARGVVGPRRSQAVRRARHARPRRPRLAATSSADVTFAAPGNQGCDITEYQVETNDGRQPGRPARPALRASPGWPTAPATPSGSGPATASAGAAGARCRPRSRPPACRRRPPSLTAPRPAPGTVDLDVERGERQRCGHHRLPGVGQRRRRRATSASSRPTGTRARQRHVVHVQGAGLQRRRLRRLERPTSATTWGEPSQVGTPSVYAGDGTLSASWSAPAANGSAITWYDVELDPGSVTSQTARSKIVERPQQRHDLPGPGPGLQRRRLRGLERVGVGHADSRRSTSRIRKDGSAVGQPGCSSSSCAWVATHRHRA